MVLSTSVVAEDGLRMIPRFPRYLERRVVVSAGIGDLVLTWWRLTIQYALNLMKPTAEQSEHVEFTGRWWESASGGGRVAGKMLGWLMVCDPAHQSSNDLAEALQTSTGSVSTQSRVLESIGLVERVTFPGDRQTYYQLIPHVWPEIMWAEKARLEQLSAVARSAARILPADRPDRVTDLDRVAQFFIEEWPGLMDRLSTYLEMEEANE